MGEEGPEWGRRGLSGGGTAHVDIPDHNEKSYFVM